VHTFIKADNTAATLYILNVITAKITTMNNNQCHGQESFLRSQQLISYS